MSNESSKTFDHKAFLATLTTRPGVYRMLDAEGTIIYVGKAKNLRRRVSSYFSRHDNSPKTRVMVSQIQAIEVTVTNTENEALLLENNLIKAHRPRYNILLRDDKSYPYIYLSADDFPRLGFQRGRRHKRGRYFGPFPSSPAVRESLNLLQKLFPVRQCEDSFFRNRSRPCLQYQIKRCSAPCVGYIDKENYQEDVRHAVMFLEGKNNAIIDELVRRMEQASAALEFELAARYRDQIATLRKVQEKQYVMGEGSADLDVIAAVEQSGVG
ncbi:MAG: excinuclease ABC subunit UvrC, partial [Gammaproteobacteria bacterium]|nr:excinuclease ABC subunit UvrC [Gammaproteobacteria bacterium]